MPWTVVCEQLPAFESLTVFGDEELLGVSQARSGVSRDGGRTWTWLDAAPFVAAAGLYAVGPNGVYRTADRWQTYAQILPAEDLEEVIAVPDGDEAWARSRSSLYRCVGSVGHKVLTSRARVNNIAVAHGIAVAAVGKRQVLVSADAGVRWTTVPLPELGKAAWLTKIVVTDRGFVGQEVNSNRLFASRDGCSWAEVAHRARLHSWVWLAAGRSLFITGASTTLRSDDFGSTWYKEPIDAELRVLAHGSGSVWGFDRSRLFRRPLAAGQRSVPDPG